MANGTMALARKAAPRILTILRDLHTITRKPVSIHDLAIHPNVKEELERVRKEAKVTGWPPPSTVMSHALQVLRREGVVVSTPKGWAPAGSVVDPAETLSPSEYESLKFALNRGTLDPDFSRKVLRSVRYRKE